MDIFSLVGKITVNYGDAVRGIDEVSSKAQGFASSLGKTMQDAGDKITSVGDKISSVGKSFAPVSVAAGGVATAALKMSMDFDSAMSQVSAVSGATGEDFEALRNKAIEMGGKTKFSASEAADAMNYMAMAGWKTEDMLSGIDGIMNLAAASGEDLATTSDIVTDALTAFGLSASDSGHFADILAAASSNANTNVSMMGETFKYIAPVAGALGYSAEDTAIAIGLMANAGIKSSQSGTSLRSALSKLVAPTDAMAESMLAFGLATQETGVDQEKFEKAQRKVESATLNVQKAQVTYNEAVAKYGEASPQAQKALIGVEQASIKLEQAQSDLDRVQNTLVGTGEFHNLVLNDENGNARSLREVLIFLRETLGDLDEQEQSAALAAVFGTEAMSGMAAIVNASEDDFEKLVGAIDNCDGVTNDMAETMQDNLAGQLTILKSQLETLAISILDLFTPALRGIVEHAQKLVDWLIGLDDGTKTLIGTVIMVVAAASPVLIIIGKVIGAVGSVIGVVGKVISVIGKVTGAIGKVITIVPKIVGAVSGVVSFVTGTVIPFIGTIVSGIGTVITTIGAVISSIGLVPIAIAALVAGVVAAGIAIWQNWDTIKEKASELWGHVKEKFNAIKESISESFSNAKEAVTNKVEEIKTNVAEGWEHMKTTITTKMGEWKENAATKLSEIKTDFTTKVSEIKSDWSEKFTGIRDTATNIMQTAKQNVSTKLAEIKTSFSTRVSEIKSDWSTKFTNLKDTAINQIQTAKQNMSTRLSEMKSNFSSKVSAIKSDWSAKFGNIKDIAINRMQTAKQNVSSKLDNIRTAFNEKGGGIKGVAAATFTAIKETIDTQMQGANILTGGKLDSIKSAFSSKLKNAYSTVSSVMENVKSAFASKMEGARTAVHGAIEKIKGLFNFSWSLPKIKLPHFNISGKFSLDPPQMPKIGVEWYKKAMDGGMIMNQPTVFGYNPKSNQLLAGGEAGSETVVGTGSLMNMIKDAVAAENNELAAVMKQILDAIVSLDEGLEGKFYNALLNTKFQVNERVFARLVRAV